MRFLDRIKYKGRAPRQLTDRDFAAWNRAASHQRGGMTKLQIQRRMQSYNFVRWNRLRRDYRWLQREMVRMGLNPEDASSLLQ